jgi:hypothetical protein
VRIIFGGNGAVPANADSNALSDKGFGIEFRTDSGLRQFRLFAHDGTNYTTSPTWQNMPGNPPTLDRPWAVVIESNGAGTISARVQAGWGPSLDLRNATPHSITGGPTIVGGGGSFVDCVIVNPGVASQNSTLALYTPPLFFIG